ncbi:glutamate carboxypeptidase [Kineosphaera limosa]|uniref:Peptidase M20 dimerisation domain-containing protein n=1 Tax=Kineosphaera limosa NBRC 100340 TaxID=1184609 RepID=K6WK65_9MICO|nr:M20/M25/M40 family metallo-hydrolase [Kineosphaera limosa]NYE02331.1 glutamate carboxypeptidase [Kineosphaera limosa]GAB94186.1 hypothetical protein KILIM_003_01090 [Kineosphaera limosa NBRC 100340]
MTHAVRYRDLLTTNVEAMIDDLRRLVHVETPSDRPDLLRAGLADIEDYVTTRLGAPSRRQRHDGGARGDVLDLTWEGTAPGAVLCLVHYDTVWPEGTVDDWPLTRDGDILTGPGVLDMKAGLVQTVWMLLVLREVGEPHPAVRLLLTGDEEIGSSVGRPHIEAAAADALVTLIPEPSAAGDVKLQRKGMVFADLQVHGVESHAGLDPDAGASAITELAALIPQINALADRERETTVNVGVIRGGSGRNVVAGVASCEVDIRIQDPAEEDRMVAALEALTVTDPRCSLEVIVERNRPPMNPTAHSQGLLTLLRTAAADLDETVDSRAVGGASDGNFVSALGLPVIDGIGGIGAGPHARHEHITVKGLSRQTALMAAVAEQLGAAHR